MAALEEVVFGGLVDGALQVRVLVLILVLVKAVVGENWLVIGRAHRDWVGLLRC